MVLVHACVHVCVPESSTVIIFNCCSYFVSCFANVTARSLKGKFLPHDAAICQREPGFSGSFMGLALSRN